MNYTLITGASSGIGKQIAISLSSKNNLILLGRNRETLLKTVEMCEKNNDIKIIVCDVQDLDSLEKALKSCLNEDVLVDSFVNSAGVIEHTFTKSFDEETISKIFKVNLLAPMSIISILLKKKINQKSLKNIVLISSANSKKQTKGMGAYNASKCALDGFMKTAALELAPDIRINSILPGFIKTEGTQKFISEDNDSEIPFLLGEGQTQYIADAVEFLLSEKSKWITGQQLIVDGGWTIA